MNTIFHIRFAMKVLDGYETYGSFCIGNERESAEQLFNQLSGSTDITGEHPLLLELIETREGLPLNLRVLGCSLSQLTDNCRTITCQMFKQLNMENG